jgi:hypothetical protein
MVARGFPVTCTDCGAPKDEQNVPCPKCDSERTTIHASASSQSMSSGRAVATVIPYSDTLPKKSKELIDNRDFNIAVVVALMACEIRVKITVTLIVAKKKLEYPQDAIFDNFSLVSDRTKKIFNALTSEQVQQAPFWTKFKESVELRNKTVHRGRAVTKVQADDAYRAASDLLTYLKKWIV